ncbi:glycosyl transferase family 39 [Scytonema hofmannii PCC 7110]|uniref:Glycosyl transferase family 39 n=1 Tax=Scytonema hofmannii PCC 7110 TaxID=128403 RepID=A0A139X1M4_9CYAN|nr:glycosyltransferase family 39 protein [Scytonema hofmannii]KYC38553.1 glycosyl transferase family 39 [Scytonema hofmannii PCC 7110]
MTNNKTPKWLKFFAITMLVVGIFFHFFNLNNKVYWHDEVYTSMRAAGFTRDEIDKELFQDRIVPATELQKYQRPKLGSTTEDTIKSLAIEDPQHPPLYFLIARFWMQTFGSSLTASRFLPVLFSLMGLPLMYALGLEVFASPIMAILATVLLALSPFDILFAQTARQYSLLTTLVIGSSFTLLQALRLPTLRNWGLYALSSALGFYSHPFFGLTTIAHGVYVLLLKVSFQKLTMTSPQAERKFYRADYKTINQFFLAIACSLLLYSPWIVVLVTNYQRAAATTDWTKFKVEFLYLLKLWILSFSSLLLDLDFGFNNIWTYVPRLTILAVIEVGIYQVCHRTPKATWLFIVTTIFVPFLLLAVPDLLLGGKRSAVSRYLISCYPGIQLVVAYLLGIHILQGCKLWRGIMVLLSAGAIASCTVSAFSETWWNKDLSYHNAEVARYINASSSPKIISEIGDDFTNTGDLISLSYLLQDDVSLVLLSQPPQLENVKSLLSESIEPFVFRPSGKFIKKLKPEQGQLVEVFAPGRLWQLKNQ